MITSEFLIVDNLCAITNTVLPSISLSIPSWTIFSVLVSILDVASSSIKTGGFAIAVLAIDKSCLWPWDKLLPSPVNTVLYPSFRCFINPCAFASFAAAITSSSVASNLPYLMFSITVPVNRWVSWRTIPSDFLKSSFLILVILIPSYLILPSCIS